MAINLTIPTTWNELSFTQLKNIVHQLEAYQEVIKDNTYTLEEASEKLYIQISKELLRGNTQHNIKKALEELHPEAYAPLSKFIYKKVERTRFILSVKIGKEKFFGPDIRLRNTVIAEFSFADVAFYKWRQTNNNLWLSVLCATLYRERATEPTEIDKRTPFQKLAVDNRADKFQKLDFKTKLAIAYTYEGSRNHIGATFKNVFPVPIETEETKNQPPKKQTYVSFGEIINYKIEGDPSKLAITNNVLTYDFLSIYDKEIANMSKK